MKIFVVLPAYDEEQALPHLLDSLVENLSEERKEYCVIVVNDGSRDRTGGSAWVWLAWTLRAEVGCSSRWAQTRTPLP